MNDDAIEVSEWQRQVMQRVKDCSNTAFIYRTRRPVIVDDCAALVEDLSRGAFAGTLESTLVVANGGPLLGSTADGSVVIWHDEIGLGVIAPDPRASTD